MLQSKKPGRDSYQIAITPRFSYGCRAPGHIKYRIIYEKYIDIQIKYDYTEPTGHPAISQHTKTVLAATRVQKE